jgi:hypothetical protein
MWQFPRGACGRVRARSASVVARRASRTDRLSFLGRRVLFTKQIVAFGRYGAVAGGALLWITYPHGEPQPTPSLG